MLGYDSIQELIGKNIAETFYQSSQERKQFLDILYREKKVADHEITLKKRDGTPVIISTNSQLLYDTAGNINGVEGFCRDISLRKQIERAHLESEERYRNVVEDQTEFICRFTPDGIITFVNDAYCRYFGLNKKTCIGSLHQVFLLDEDVGLMKQHLASLTLENPTGTIEHRVILPDGKIRWHFWTDRAIFNADRMVTEYQSVGIDTTEKQELTQKICESEERFRMITELSPFPLSLIDSSGNYRYLNKKFEKLFGYTITDIPTEKDWFLKAFPDITDRTNAIKTWKQDRCEDWDMAKPRLFSITCKDGSVRQIHFCPITLKSGEQFVVYEDLTDKTESDRLRSILASIVNSSSDAIIGKTLDGTIQSWNKAAERYYGYLAEEMIGNHISLIIPPEFRDQIPHFLRRVATGETIERFDTIRLRKDGSRIEVCVTLSPIKDEEGHIIGISTIAQNIAERKKSDVSRIFRQQVLHRR
jgi:PAS domain S-box-containing protein